MGKVLGMGGKDQPNAQVKLDINDLTDREATMFKKLSALLSPTGKEQVVPIPVYRCDECGHINDGFLPKITKK